MIGTTSYWLSQTVYSDHLNHNFSFSIVSKHAGSKARHADLIEAANVPAKGPRRKSRLDDDDSYSAFERSSPGPYNQFAPANVRFSLQGTFGEEPSTVTISGDRYLGIDRIDETSLALDAVAARLHRAKARVAVFLDVCHAGLAGRIQIASNSDAEKRLITESGASMVIFSASKGLQVSEESLKAGGSLFSLALERILDRDRKAYDLNGNGAISVSELYRGLKSEVVDASAGRQIPWLSRNLVVGDFNLF
jgi:hypothetical protein